MSKAVETQSFEKFVVKLFTNGCGGVSWYINNLDKKALRDFLIEFKKCGISSGFRDVIEWDLAKHVYLWLSTNDERKQIVNEEYADLIVRTAEWINVQAGIKLANIDKNRDELLDFKRVFMSILKMPNEISIDSRIYQDFKQKIKGMIKPSSYRFNN